MQKIKGSGANLFQRYEGFISLQKYGKTSFEDAILAKGYIIKTLIYPYLKKRKLIIEKF